MIRAYVTYDEARSAAVRLVEQTGFKYRIHRGERCWIVERQGRARAAARKS
jgi:hypothetical protein